VGECYEHILTSKRAARAETDSARVISNCHRHESGYTPTSLHAANEHHGSTTPE
jgi:hypothetical protein